MADVVRINFASRKKALSDKSVKIGDFVLWHEFVSEDYITSKVLAIYDYGAARAREDAERILKGENPLGPEAFPVIEASSHMIHEIWLKVQRDDGTIEEISGELVSAINFKKAAS